MYKTLGLLICSSVIALSCFGMYDQFIVPTSVDWDEVVLMEAPKTELCQHPTKRLQPTHLVGAYLREIPKNDYKDVCCDNHGSDCQEIKPKCRKSCCPKVRLGGVSYALRYLYNGLTEALCNSNHKSS